MASVCVLGFISLSPTYGIASHRNHFAPSELPSNAGYPEGAGQWGGYLRQTPSCEKKGIQICNIAQVSITRTIGIQRMHPTRPALSVC
jgi:hypothetical protein